MHRSERGWRRNTAGLLTSSSETSRMAAVNYGSKGNPEPVRVHDFAFPKPDEPEPKRL